MLQNKGWSARLARLLAIVLMSTLFFESSGALGQEDLSPEPPAPQNQIADFPSRPTPTAEPQHADGDYELAEAARKRNEPRFEAPRIQTRAVGSPNQVGQWGGVTLSLIHISSPRDS